MQSISVRPPRLPWLPERGSARHSWGRGIPPRALPLVALEGLSSLLTLALEPTALPCSTMSCGDVLYSSTLDPILRMEQHGFNPDALLLAAATLAYLFAKPGVLPGALDYYVLAPLQRASAPAYTKDDFTLTKKLGDGGFGTAWKAELKDPQTGDTRTVVIKQAKEFGEAECWMNERMMRAAPWAIAQFITAFADNDAKSGPLLWLVWAYEGDMSLADALQRKDFPTCVEPVLFGRQLRIPEGPQRRAAVVRLLMQQLLECLKACHDAGIVHRDIKPDNLMLSEAAGRLKLIDLGAAADMRVGINYSPNGYLLDERYAPPQKRILAKHTARAPPKPLAALLSPVLWNGFQPDRFDMWSVGMTLLQLACPNLRSDAGFTDFRRQLRKQYSYDLAAWRAGEAAAGRLGKAWAEGLAVLDEDGGALWDLACKLVQPNPRDRPSCAAALAHRAFDPAPLSGASALLGGMTRQGKMLGNMGLGGKQGELTARLGRLAGQEAVWLEEHMACAYDGMSAAGGFSELQLLDEDLETEASGHAEVHEEHAEASQTLVWWQGRQAAQEVKLQRRKQPGSTGDARPSKSGKSGKSAGSSSGRRKAAKQLVAAGGGILNGQGKVAGKGLPVEHQQKRRSLWERLVAHARAP